MPVRGPLRGRAARRDGRAPSRGPVPGCSAGIGGNSDRRRHRRYLARRSHGICLILAKKLCRQVPQWLPFRPQMTACTAPVTKRKRALKAVTPARAGRALSPPHLSNWRAITTPEPRPASVSDLGACPLPEPLLSAVAVIAFTAMAVWGARSLLTPVTCIDRRLMAIGNDDHPCLSVSLPDVHPGLRLAGPARPVHRVQGHRGCSCGGTSCRAAPHQAPARAGVGRPRGPRRADPPPAAKAADAPAGHPGHRPAVAPPLGHPEGDLPAPDGPAPVSAEIAGLIERLATGNNGWGYQRIRGELL